MPSVPIEHVPDETHAVLRRRAALAHRSLQEHVLPELGAEDATPSLEEVLERADRRTGGAVTFADAVEAVQEDRDRR